MRNKGCLRPSVYSRLNGLRQRAIWGTPEVKHRLRYQAKHVSSLWVSPSIKWNLPTAPPPRSVGNTWTHKQCSYARDRVDPHTEEVETNLGQEGEARVDISSAGWMVTSRWDRHHGGIKFICIRMGLSRGHSGGTQRKGCFFSFLRALTPSRNTATTLEGKTVGARLTHFKKLHELRRA